MKLLLATVGIVIGAVASLLYNHATAKHVAKAITEAGLGVETIIPEVDGYVLSHSALFLWQVSWYLKAGCQAGYEIYQGKVYFYLVNPSQLQFSH
jgi:hypothetical protein